MLRRILQFTVLAGCLSAAAAVAVAADSAPFTAPAPIVYVADFDCQAAWRGAVTNTLSSQV